MTPTKTLSNSVTPTTTLSNSVTPTITVKPSTVTPTLTFKPIAVTPTATLSNSITPTLSLSSSVTPTITVSPSVPCHPAESSELLNAQQFIHSTTQPNYANNFYIFSFDGEIYNGYDDSKSTSGFLTDFTYLNVAKSDIGAPMSIIHNFDYTKEGTIKIDLSTAITNRTSENDTIGIRVFAKKTKKSRYDNFIRSVGAFELDHDVLVNGNPLWSLGNLNGMEEKTILKEIPNNFSLNDDTFDIDSINLIENIFNTETKNNYSIYHEAYRGKGVMLTLDFGVSLENLDGINITSASNGDISLLLVDEEEKIIEVNLDSRNKNWRDKVTHFNGETIDSINNTDEPIREDYEWWYENDFTSEKAINLRNHICQEENVHNLFRTKDDSYERFAFDNIELRTNSRQWNSSIVNKKIKRIHVFSRSWTRRNDAHNLIHRLIIENIELFCGGQKQKILIKPEYIVPSTNPWERLTNQFGEGNPNGKSRLGRTNILLDCYNDIYQDQGQHNNEYGLAIDDEEWELIHEDFSYVTSNADANEEEKRFLFREPIYNKTDAIRVDLFNLGNGDPIVKVNEISCMVFNVEPSLTPTQSLPPTQTPSNQPTPTLSPSNIPDFSTFPQQYVSIDALEVQIQEGFSGNVIIKRNKLLSENLDPVEIEYIITDGTAKKDTDYIMTGGTVVFEEGELEVEVSLSTIPFPGEWENEPKEYFVFELKADFYNGNYVNVINAGTTVNPKKIYILESSPTPTRTPTLTSTPSITPTITPSITVTTTPSLTPSHTPTLTPTITVSNTTTPSVTKSQYVAPCEGSNYNNVLLIDSSISDFNSAGFASDVSEKTIQDVKYLCNSIINRLDNFIKTQGPSY